GRPVSIGYLEAPCPRPGSFELFFPAEAIRDALQQMGHLHGRDITYERACAADRVQLVAVAHDLVQRATIIVAIGAEALRAAMDVTTTIPIVMLAPDVARHESDRGSLRPAANVTGVSLSMAEPARRRLEILKQLALTLSRIAVLWNPEDSGATREWRGLLAAAGPLGLTLEPKEIRDPGDLETALVTMALSQARGLIVTLDALTYATRHRITEFATTGRFPAIHPIEAFVRAGGLLAYGPRFSDLAWQVAGYVDKILDGVRPGDLPIEQPTKFELVINLKAATALGLTIPPPLLLRADQVIDP
ncbi:MAG: ABC transporter substrate-binding protein, partial [Candidatus Limnocylindria bacterium]